MNFDFVEEPCEEAAWSASGNHATDSHNQESRKLNLVKRELQSMHYVSLALPCAKICSILNIFNTS
jgi:hypothetical protein